MNLCPCVVRCVGRPLLMGDERWKRKRLASSRSVPSRATARPVGVDFGRAWLTLEHVRVLGHRADADAAVAGSACTGAPRRWSSCASLRGFYPPATMYRREGGAMPSIGQEN